MIRTGVKGNDVFMRIIRVIISKEYNRVCYEAVKSDDPRADDDKPIGFFAEEDARPAQLDFFQ